MLHLEFRSRSLSFSKLTYINLPKSPGQKTQWGLISLILISILLFLILEVAHHLLPGQYQKGRSICQIMSDFFLA